MSSGISAWVCSVLAAAKQAPVPLVLSKPLIQAPCQQNLTPAFQRECFWPASGPVPSGFGSAVLWGDLPAGVFAVTGENLIWKCMQNQAEHIFYLLIIKYKSGGVSELVWLFSPARDWFGGRSQLCWRQQGPGFNGRRCSRAGAAEVLSVPAWEAGDTSPWAPSCCHPPVSPHAPHVPVGHGRAAPNPCKAGEKLVEDFDEKKQRRHEAKDRSSCSSISGLRQWL